MNNKSRITGKRKNYSQVSNHPLQNPELSMKAKGLYAMIESYLSIPNFTLYKTTLVKDMKDGKSAFESAWKELKNSGYLAQSKNRNPKSNQFYYEYELLEVPHPDFEGLENPVHGKPGSYNNTHLSNTYLNNTNKRLRHSGNDGYLFFEDLEDEDLVKQVNRIISHGRTKITKNNYHKAIEMIEEIIEYPGIDDFNDFMNRYLDEKTTGRSVENFIKHLERCR